MISKKVTAFITVLSVVLMTFLTVGTLYETHPSISLSTNGYLDVDNHTEQYYAVTDNTSQLVINFTIYTSSPTLYIYDISPINNTSAVWQNLTCFNSSVYPHNYIKTSVSNGTLISLTLMLNSSAVRQMKLSNPSAGEVSPYIVKILIFNGAMAATGFGFALLRV
ncbi:MAG: hypothetical protein M1533_03320 [Candidatus Thermoplasmatota archaeon]|jgi:hypothetical protein|nr:hypothetical protein [Candidatus Thermoplasmatota archaeon]MCL5794075.1 hypothetical protein [Candidatus Thermoplasmatota archaeon]